MYYTLAPIETQAGFIQVPLSILKAHGRAALAAAAVTAGNGRRWTTEQAAHNVGCGLGPLKRYRKELIDAGWLHRVRGTRTGQPSLYIEGSRKWQNEPHIPLYRSMFKLSWSEQLVLGYVIYRCHANLKKYGFGDSTKTISDKLGLDRSTVKRARQSLVTRELLVPRERMASNDTTVARNGTLVASNGTTYIERLRRERLSVQEQVLEPSIEADGPRTSFTKTTKPIEATKTTGSTRVEIPNIEERLHDPEYLHSLYRTLLEGNSIPATLSFELFEVNVIKCCEIGDNPRAMLYVKIRDGRWYDEVLEVPEERGEDRSGPDRFGGFDRLSEFEAWKKSEGLDTPEKYEAWEKEREKQSNLWLMHQARAKNRYLEHHGPIYGRTTRYRDDGTAFTVDLGAPDRRTFEEFMQEIFGDLKDREAMATQESA